jgi:hypothetical protein
MVAKQRKSEDMACVANHRNQAGSCINLARKWTEKAVWKNIIAQSDVSVLTVVFLPISECIVAGNLQQK